jgi:small neutral amino acid transporter SnatA (MarC family)
MVAIGPSTLQVLGAIFGVLQLALAIQMIFWAVKSTFAITGA